MEIMNDHGNHNALLIGGRGEKEGHGTRYVNYITLVPSMIFIVLKRRALCSFRSEIRIVKKYFPNYDYILQFQMLQRGEKEGESISQQWQ